MGGQVVIGEFKGAFAFLSNFWTCDVEMDGTVYPSVEHAFQAAKTVDDAEREWVRKAPDAAEARKRGWEVKLRRDWARMRLDVMESLLRKKFDIPTLRDRLLATGTEQLTEGNWWCDLFWGVCGIPRCAKNLHVDPSGFNHLGRLLMERRSKIRAALNVTSTLEAKTGARVRVMAWHASMQAGDGLIVSGPSEINMFRVRMDGECDGEVRHQILFRHEFEVIAAENDGE